MNSKNLFKKKNLNKLNFSHIKTILNITQSQGSNTFANDRKAKKI